jgi:ABC-type transport system involved in multi-copper enzyme maturation permease subunit
MPANSMIVYKTWLDTRWRFVIGLVLMMCSAASAVLAYPTVVDMLPLTEGLEAEGIVGEEIRRMVELSSTFRGYMWSQWSTQNLSSVGTLFPVLLGAGAVVSMGMGGGAYYTLALPVSRRRLLATRAATGLAQVFAMMLLSHLTIVALSPAIGESYSLADALVHGACAFFAASVLFSLTLFLATVFSDAWRPLLISLAVGAAIGVAELFLRNSVPFGLYRTMSAETYFRDGGLPWLGLLACAAGSAAMIYAAVLNLERRNF